MFYSMLCYESAQWGLQEASTCCDRISFWTLRFEVPTSHARTPPWHVAASSHLVCHMKGRTSPASHLSLA